MLIGGYASPSGHPILSVCQGLTLTRALLFVHPNPIPDPHPNADVCQGRRGGYRPGHGIAAEMASLRGCRTLTLSETPSLTLTLLLTLTLSLTCLTLTLTRTRTLIPP